MANERITAEMMLEAIMTRLDETEQARLVNMLLDDEVIPSDQLIKRLSWQQCFEEVQASDTWIDEALATGAVDENSIAGLINFSNSNTVAHALVHNGGDQQTATALYNELSYWREQGLI